MEWLRQLGEAEKIRVTHLLGRLLDQRSEIRFACLHGSFVERNKFRDVDLAVWLDPARLSQKRVVDYEFDLSAWLERQIPLPVDVKVLNEAPLSFRFAATRGAPLLVRDEEEWFAFRERTWRDYFDFAPLARAALRDLLDLESGT